MRKFTYKFFLRISINRLFICSIVKMIYLLIIIIQFIYIMPLSAQEFVERYISNIAYSPNFTEDHTIFVCVWGSGLYRSQDEGETWTKIELPIYRWDTENYVQGLALSPDFAIDSTIFVGALKLYRSKDGGNTWKDLNFGTNPPITDIAISPNFRNDRTLYVSMFGGSIGRNTMAGEGDWGGHSPLDAFVWCATLSPDFVNDSTLFAGTRDIGICRSKDRGETWEEVTADLPNQGSIVMSIDIAKEEKTIYAATYDGIIKSTDGGDIWSVLNNGLVSLVCRDVSLSPNFSSDQTIFLGTADGVFKSTSRGASWFSSSSGITTLYIYKIAISPTYSTDHTLLAGTAEGLFKSTNGGISWLPANNGLEVATVPNITKSPFIFDALPSCAIGANNVLHVVWSGLYANVDAPDGVVADVFYMKRQKGVWSKPAVVSVPTGYYSKDISIAVDKEGHPHIAFRRSTDQISSMHGDCIYYTHDPGTGFVEPTLVVDGNLPPYRTPNNPSLAIDNSGVAYIAFTSQPDKVLYTNNKNGNFETPVEVLSGDYVWPSVDIAVDHNYKVHMAIGTSFNWPQKGIYYVNNLSGNFSEPLKVSEEDGDHPCIALDSQGNVHISFYYNVRGDKRIGYVTNKTGTFKSPQYIYGYHHPSMSVDFKDKVHIAAQSVDFSPYDVINQIAYANNINGEFIDREITDLIRGVATAGRRYIAIGPDDSVHIVYANGSMGSYDLYYLCFSPTSSMFQPPIVDFSGTPNRGSTGLKVTFRNLSTGYTTLKKWYFGDGEVSWETNPVHTYYSDSLRTYTVSLVVKGVTTDSTTKVNYITVTGINHWPVLLNANVVPDSGDTNTEFNFSVTYSDFDGDPPYKANIKVDSGNWLDMNKITDDYLNGALYQYSSTISEGAHNYRFQFVDSTGNHYVYLPASGQFNGPNVISTKISQMELHNQPKEYGLFQNYPNPFNPTTIISYQIPKKSYVKLQIFNMSGQLVRELENSEKPLGYYNILWDGKDSIGKFLASGIYICEIKASNFRKSIKLSLLK